MGLGTREVIVNYEKVISSQRSFAMGRAAIKPFTTRKGPRHESRVARGADMWEITFEIVTDPREIIVDRLRVDMMAHENSEKAECFGSGVNGSLMKVTKGEIRVGARIV
jgi:hypothetical protein